MPATTSRTVTVHAMPACRLAFACGEGNSNDSIEGAV